MAESQSSAIEAEPRPRVLLVDDDEVFRSSTAKLLRDSGYPCACAPDPAAGESLLAQDPVDVLISDLVFGDELQLDLLRRAAELERPPACILVTAHPSVETAIEALDLGVVGYLVKPFEIDELVSRIDEAARRRAFRDLLDRARLSLMDARQGIDGVYRLMDTLPLRDAASEAHTETPPFESRLLETLTRRERELVGELMLGYRVSTIARRLHISPHTVRRHLKNIFLKLEVKSQAELLEKLKPWTRG